MLYRKYWKFYTKFSKRRDSSKQGNHNRNCNIQKLTRTIFISEMTQFAANLPFPWHSFFYPTLLTKERIVMIITHQQIALMLYLKTLILLHFAWFLYLECSVLLLLKNDDSGSNYIFHILSYKMSNIVCYERSTKTHTDAAIKHIYERDMCSVKTQTSNLSDLHRVILPFLGLAQEELGGPLRSSLCESSILIKSDSQSLGTHPESQHRGLGNYKMPWLKNELQLMGEGVSTQLGKGWTEDKHRQKKKKKRKKSSLAWKMKQEKIRGSNVWLHLLHREKTAKQFNFEFFLSLLTRRHFQRKINYKEKSWGPG